ncbi:helix-turn-helix transcriptional regulator [Bdellovibrio sp. BCCA]|uniref:helix-turn-helix transcriptional regulator n=1 Tax=Bdellovibrio sp. BCCA TaxID=3136281 RepID=UPI0030F05C76
MTTKRKTKREDALTMLERKFGRLSVAEFLWAWRVGDEMSQKQFAKKLGISVQSLCDLEKGRRIPSPARAAKIAKKLGYSEPALIMIALRDSLHAAGFNYKVTIESA